MCGYRSAQTRCGPTHDVVGRHTSGLATTGHPPEWLNQPRWLNKAYSPSVRSRTPWDYGDCGQPFHGPRGPLLDKHGHNHRLSIRSRRCQVPSSEAFKPFSAVRKMRIASVTYFV